MIFRFQGRRKWSDQPVLFHVTHAKAGSTWLYEIFRAAFPGRVAQRLGGRIEGIDAKPGDIHSAVFCSHDDYTKIRGAQGAKCFYVMRDVRDAMVSLYFSLRYSHPEYPHVKDLRAKLQAMSEQEGLALLFSGAAVALSKTQSTWLESGVPVYRYEDLFATQGTMLAKILDDIGFEYDAKRLKKSIEKNSFEKRYRRKPGVTDNHSHGRRGLPGGWRELLTDELEVLIRENLWEHLKRTGYES